MQNYINSFIDYFNSTASLSGIFTDYLFIMIWIILAFVFQVLVHESGHCIFGLLTGYRFLSFRIFNLILTNNKGKIHIGKYSYQGSLGQCLMQPPVMKDEMFPFVLYAMGGTIMDAVLLIIALSMASSMSISFLVNTGLIVCSLYALANIIGNAIPITGAAINNDGTNVYYFMKDKQAVKSTYIQLNLVSKMMDAATYKDLPEEYVTVPEGSDLKNGLIAWHKITQCYYNMELGRWEDAMHCINEIENAGGKKCQLLKNCILAEKLFLYIMMKKNSSEIEDLHKKLKKILKKDSDIQIYKVKKAYEIYKCMNASEKEMIFNEVLHRCENYPYKGEAIFCTEIIRGMIN